MSEKEQEQAKGVKKTKTTTEIEEPILDEGEEDGEPATGPESELPRELAEMFSDLGTDARLQIYRRPPGGRKKYLDTIDPWDFRMEWLREEWGGGRYQLSLRRDGKYAGAVTVEIEGPPKKPKPDDDDDDDDDAGISPQLGVVIAETLRELRDLRRDMLHPPAGAQQGNPVEMGLSIATALQEATTPLVSEILSLMRERESEKRDPEDMMEVFFRGIEFSREISGPPAGSNPYLEMARPLVESLTRTLESQQGGAPRLPAFRPGGGAAASPPPGADRMETDDERDARRPEQGPPGWVHFLRPIVSQLEMAARTDGDPGLYAELLLDQALNQADEAQARDVELFLETATENLDAFLVDFFRWLPETRDYRDWFAGLWREIRDQLRDDGSGPEDVDAVESGGPPEDAPPESG